MNFATLRNAAKTLRRIMMAMAMCLSLLVAGAVAGQAAPPSAIKGSSETLTKQEAQRQLDAFLPSLMAGTAKTAGKVTFDPAPAKAAGVPTAQIKQYALGIVMSSGIVTGDSQLQAQIANAPTAARACQGSNGWNQAQTQWWQPTVIKVTINSCNVATIQGIWTAGGGVIGIAAGIAAATGVGAPIAGVVAGALAVAGGLIGWCNNQGRGVAIVLINGIPTGCFSQ